MAKLSVHLVAWNGARYIPFLFESLRAQTYKNWEILIIDNRSSDNTVEAIEKELKNFNQPWQMIKNEKNIGFAPGHNQAIRMTKGEYVQLLNQDMYLAPDYLEKVVAIMEAHPEAGAGQGMLLKWNFELGVRSYELGQTDIVDTLGLKVFRNRRVVDWKTGETLQSVISTPPWRGRNLTASLKQGVGSLAVARDDIGSVVEVFGVSGALPIYRRKMIESVAFENQMFDEDFFMYKEDVDLAFRLRSAGWKAYLEPQARAWHDRTAAGPREVTDQAALNNRKTKSAFVNYHSYKNHLMVLLKNEHYANFTKDWPWIIWYELKKFVYLAIFDRATLKDLKEVTKLWPRTMRKRAFIMKNYKIKPEKIKIWFK